MEASKVKQLKELIEECKSDPSILSHPSLSFFQDYVTSVGREIPSPGEDYKAVEMKAHEIEEHRRKYEKLRKEREETIDLDDFTAAYKNVKEQHSSTGFTHGSGKYALDPEVVAAIGDVIKNPANAANYDANPKVAPYLSKLIIASEVKEMK